MKLRRCFAPHQLLFVFALFASAALAQDKIILKDGNVQTAKITGVTGSSIQVAVGAGTIGVPLANVAQVEMAPPADYNLALSAFQAKDYQKALTAAKAVTEKFKGLPAAWAQRATALLGDIHIELGDLKKAEAAYNDFQKIYPGAGALQSNIGMARIALAKKDHSVVKQKLEPVVAEALKQKEIPKAAAAAYSQAFYLLGQAEEAQGHREAALVNYLRTVTIFHHDRTAATAAQEKADALRKGGELTVP